MRQRLAAAAVAIGTVAVVVAGAGAAADPVRLNMPSAFPGSLVQLGESGVRFEETVNAIAGGEVEVKFFEPSALVPALEIYDAVASGSVDAGWSAAGYWASKNSALALFSAVPFGPAAGEYLAWMWFRGGEALMNGIYNRDGLQSLVCGVVAPEASGWFRKEIDSPADLKGLKMRFYGLGARVMQKLGVETELLAGGDIYPALESGAIDATEFSMPAIDEALGFQAVAKHYYFPGWHQQSTLLELLLNKAKWDSMTGRQREIIRTACRATVARQFAEGEAIQGQALAEMEADGVIVHRWSPQMLDTFRGAWAEVVAEESAKNPDFRRVWESLSAFRAEYARWKDLGYLQ